MNEVKRFCEDCKTTRTPLWRSGPNGPRSLCNACGIKYRKRKAAEKRRNSQTSEESCSTSSTSDHQMKETLNMRSVYNEYDPRHVIIQTPLSSPYSSSLSLLSSRVKKQRSRRHSINHSSETNWEFGEVEEAAFLLMSMSCDSVFA